MIIYQKITLLMGYFCIINSLSLKCTNCFSDLSSAEKEQALINKLLKNYSKKQKPMGTVQVKFSLNLNQIVSVKAKDQVFILNVFLDHEWVDSRLSWDPVENGNITILRISSEFLWTPDTFVYTTADNTGFVLPQMGAYFVVGNDGKIFWPNPLPQMKVRCSMGIAWFPYDDHICEIIFGSWSNTMSYLNYSLMNEDSALAGYQENSEWSLINYKGIRNLITYDNWIEQDSFSNIHYKIFISRKPLFVLQNYCIPAVMLCIITLCMFYMPFPQEMQLGISVMLTFSILKLKLSDDVPAQSDSIPLFNIYFTGCMVFSLLSIIWFNQQNLFSTKKKLPKIIRWFILKYVCFIMIRPDHKVSKVDKLLQIAEEIKKKDEREDVSKLERKKDAICLKNRGNDDFSRNSDTSIKNRFTDFRILESASFFSLKPIENPRDFSSNNEIETFNSKRKVSFTFETEDLKRETISQGATQDSNTEDAESIIAEVKCMENAEVKPPEKPLRIEYTDMEMLPILNDFIFYLFVAYFVLLNLLLLIVIPWLFKAKISF